MATSRHESATKIPKTLRVLAASAPEAPARKSSLPKRAGGPRRMGTLPRRTASVLRLSAFELATSTVAGTAIALAQELQEARARFEDELRSLAPLTSGAPKDDPQPMHRDAQIERLERESQRLVVLLAETERQRDEARATLAALQRTRGIAPATSQKAPSAASADDPRRDAKMAIIKELLEQNRELRRALVAGASRSDAPPAPDATPADAKEAITKAPEAAPADAKEAITKAPEAAPAQAMDVAAKAAADATDAAVDAEDAPLVNPDDLPWQPSGEAAEAAGTNESKVEFKRFEPPVPEVKQDRPAPAPRHSHGRRKRR